MLQHELLIRHLSTHILERGASPVSSLNIPPHPHLKRSEGVFSTSEMIIKMHRESQQLSRDMGDIPTLFVSKTLQACIVESPSPHTLSMTDKGFPAHLIIYFNSHDGSVHDWHAISKDISEDPKKAYEDVTFLATVITQAVGILQSSMPTVSSEDFFDGLDLVIASGHLSKEQRQAGYGGQTPQTNPHGHANIVFHDKKLEAEQSTQLENPGPGVVLKMVDPISTVLVNRWSESILKIAEDALKNAQKFISIPEIEVGSIKKGIRVLSSRETELADMLFVRAMEENYFSKFKAILDVFFMEYHSNSPGSLERSVAKEKVIAELSHAFPYLKEENVAVIIRDLTFIKPLYGQLYRWFIEGNTNIVNQEFLESEIKSRDVTRITKMSHAVLAQFARLDSADQVTTAALQFFEAQPYLDSHTEWPLIQFVVPEGILPTVTTSSKLHLKETNDQKKLYLEEISVTFSAGSAGGYEMIYNRFIQRARPH